MIHERMAALGLLAVIVLAEAWCIHDRVSAWRDAGQRRHAGEGELVAMRTVNPPPSREAAAAIEAELAQVRHLVAMMKAELSGRGAAAGHWRRAKIPEVRSDAFFDLAIFVERMRELAQKQGVEVKPPAARFGFASHAHEGPETGRIEAVFRQRLAVQYVMEALLAARPRALLAVRREIPLPRQQRVERLALATATAASQGDSDFFSIHPDASVRRLESVATVPLQVTFVGQTETLRQFCNRLTSLELPFLIREVEVGPAAPDDTPIAAGVGAEAAAGAHRADRTAAILTSGKDGPLPEAEPAGAGARPPLGRSRLVPVESMPGAAPIVARPWSIFTVTVELVDLAEAVPSATEPGVSTS